MGVKGWKNNRTKKNKDAFQSGIWNTLFDVENERLEQENNERIKTKCQIEEIGKSEPKYSEDIHKNDENCETFEGIEEHPSDELEDIEPNEKEISETVSNNLPETTEEEVKVDKVENTKQAKECAKEKLEADLKKAKDKSFAEPIIGYLLERCAEEEGLSIDVTQEHKSWEKCFSYIFEKAKKQETGNCAAVRDVVVYEWAEDYYHLDDKALEEKKRKDAAEIKKKQDQKKVQNTIVTTKPKKKSAVALEFNGLEDSFSLFDLI